MNAKQRSLCKKLEQEGILPDDIDCDSRSKKVKDQVLKAQKKRSARSKSPVKKKKSSSKKKRPSKSRSLSSKAKTELVGEFIDLNEAMVDISRQLEVLIQSSKSSPEPVKSSTRTFISSQPIVISSGSSSEETSKLETADRIRKQLILEAEENERKREEAKLKKQLLEQQEQQLILAKRAEDEKKRQQLEAAKRAEEEKKRQQLEAAQRAEEEKRKQQLEAAQRAEEEKKRLQLEAAKRAEEEKKRQQLEAVKRAEEEKKKEQLEAAKRAEEEKKRQQLEAVKRAEEENKKEQLEAAQRAEEEKKKQQLEAAQRAEEEKKRQQLEAAKRAEEEKKKEQLEAAKRAEEEKKRQQLEAAQRAEEEKKRQQLEAAQRAEEEKKKQELEAAKRAEEEKRKPAKTDQAGRILADEDLEVITARKQISKEKDEFEKEAEQWKARRSSIPSQTNLTEEEKRKQQLEASKKAEEETKLKDAESAKNAEEEKKKQQLEIAKKAKEEADAKSQAEASQKAEADKKKQDNDRQAKIQQLQQKWNAENINNIRAELKKRQITASGNKNQLISKLVESDLENEAKGKTKTDQSGQIIQEGPEVIASKQKELEFAKETAEWKAKKPIQTTTTTSLSDKLQSSLTTTKSLEAALADLNQGKPVVTTPATLLTLTPAVVAETCDTLFNVKNASGSDCWLDSLLIALFGPKSDKIKKQFLDKNPADLDLQVKDGKKFKQAPLETKEKLHQILTQANAIIHQDPESIKDKSGKQQVCNNLRLMLSKFKSYIEASGFDDPSNAWNALQSIYNPTVMVLQKKNKIQGILPSRHDDNQINQAFVDKFKLKSAEFLVFYVDRQTYPDTNWFSRDVEFSKTLTLPSGQVFTIASFVAYEGGKTKNTGDALPGHFVAYVRCGDQSWLKFDDLSGSSTPERINSLPKDNLSKESIIVFYV